MTLAFHPYANLFPLLEGPAFDELVADIKANGLREKIAIFEDKVLDGRNRYRAGVAAGLIDPEAPAHNGIGMQPWCVLFLPEYNGEPLAWVLSKNLHRRHLNESQRAMVAARLARMERGRPAEWNAAEEKAADLPVLSDVKQEQAAELLHVSERSVRTARRVQEQGAPELVEAVDRGEVAVSAAAALAQLPADAQVEILATEKPQHLARAARERVGGHRAIMADRREPADSLDYFPTPPWAVRALVDDVLRRHLGVRLAAWRVWEPACGEGHITGVLLEYGVRAVGTDIFDYSAGGRAPPGWDRAVDFLAVDETAPLCDWLITNPPFGEAGLGFALKALAVAEQGVALFVRQQWLEGVDRYERLFRDRPPTLVAQFAERVNLCKGRWEPDGSTATAYCWLVWQKGWLAGKPPVSRPEFFWIPPGRRAERWRADDVARFTAHPALPPASAPATASEPSGRAGAADPAQGPEAARDAHAGAGVDHIGSVILGLRPDCLHPEPGRCASPGGTALCHECAKAKAEGIDIPAFLGRAAAGTGELGRAFPQRVALPSATGRPTGGALA